jgi:hypothetical protein
MGAKAASAFRRHPFLLLGFFTLGLFYLVAAFDGLGYSGLSSALAVPLRVLVVPMYLVWMVWSMAWVTLVGPTSPGLLAAISSFLGLVAGLAPYALADLVLQLRRQAADRKTSGPLTDGE